MTFVATVSLALAAALFHKVEDGFFMRYPCMTNGDDRIEKFNLEDHLIPGASAPSNRIFIGRGAAKSMAGTADAFLQRVVFGEGASRGFPYLTNYTDTTFEIPGARTSYINLFNATNRNLRKTVRITSVFDEAPSELLSPNGFIGEQKTPTSLRNGGGLFYWMNSNAKVPFSTSSEKQYLSQIFEDVGGIQNAWHPNLSDLDLNDGFTHGNDCSSLLLGIFEGPSTPYDAYPSKYDTPYEHQGLASSFFASSNGRTDWNSRLRHKVGYASDRGVYYFDFIKSVYGENAFIFDTNQNDIPPDWPGPDFTPFERYVRRITFARFALANQLLGAMDTTLAPWDYGTKPLYEMRVESCSALLENTYEDSNGMVALLTDEPERGVFITPVYDTRSHGKLVRSDYQATTNVFVSRKRYIDARATNDCNTRWAIIIETEPDSVIMKGYEREDMIECEFGDLRFEDDNFVRLGEEIVGEWKLSRQGVYARAKIQIIGIVAKLGME